MALRSTQKDVSIISTRSTTGSDTTTGFNVSDFRDAVLSIASKSHATATIKVQGAIGTTPPDFTAAASTTNKWAYVQIVNLDTGSAVNGSTGVSFSSENTVYLDEVNINALDWLNCNITSISSGSLSVVATFADNQ